MDKRILELVLLDQKDELRRKRYHKFCTRKEESLIDLHSPLAQVVIGVRRCGKSTMCFNVLEKSGVKYAYVNFDDERLYNLSSADLNDVLEVLYKIYGSFDYLFIDEIQNIPEWYLFVNRLLRREMHLIITGSNAKLLSGELATHLTGRHNPIVLYPFSFEEFCEYKNVNTHSLTTEGVALLRKSFDDYLSLGGMPEILNNASPKRYISALTQNIITRDLEERFKITFKTTFEDVANHLLNVSPWRFSSKTLMDEFGLKTDNTVKKYVQYLVDGFLLQPLHKFSFKSHDRIVSYKLYVVDVAFMNNRENAMAKENLGWRLETSVFIELRRRCNYSCNELYYYSDRVSECDFVIVNSGKVEQLIQVSYDITNPNTLKREIKGLIRAAETTGCTDLLLLTDNQSRDITVDEHLIKIRSVYDYILNM